MQGLLAFFPQKHLRRNTNRFRGAFENLIGHVYQGTN